MAKAISPRVERKVQAVVGRLSKWKKPSKVTGDFRCGMCGKKVKPYNCSLKCDGWHWHSKCWKDFWS